ncbi:glycosyltransferase family 9 protein [Methylobacillus methanolivorans]|uniref:Glycosyltransferase family 9 protein n=1 Tax=Methylobacillus methanolivorans TaxID=1848927 RepID=A0ABW8GMY5_9PROT
MGFELLSLPPEQRHCEVIAVVDDFRAQERNEYYKTPLITSIELSKLAEQHHDLIAINTCEHPKPKQFFERLCQENNIPSISFQQAEQIFPVLRNKRRQRRKTLRRTLYSRTIDWLVFHLGKWPCKRNGIALTRLDGAGDFLLWLDAAKHICNHHPGQKITLFANAHWAEYATTFSYWDRVVAVDTTRINYDLAYRLKIILSIWWEGYAIAINPTFYRRYIDVTDTLIRISGAPVRIGWDCGVHTGLTMEQKNQTDDWYTRLFTPSTTSPTTPEIVHDAEFASQLIGFPIPPALHPLPQRKVRVLVPDHDYCVLFPGASWSGRRWPVEHFAELGARLQQHFGWHIVLCGSIDEKPLCDAIEQQITAEHVLNLAGHTTFVELVEVIRSAQLLVSNETSAIHIAPAVDTESVCILGGGHYGLFVPYPSVISGMKPAPAINRMDCYHCHWRCSQLHEVNKAVPCIEHITVKDVFDIACQTITKNSWKPIAKPD